MNLPVAPIAHEGFSTHFFTVSNLNKSTHMIPSGLLSAFQRVIGRAPQVAEHRLFARHPVPTGEMILGPWLIWLGMVRSATLVSVSKS